MRSRRRAYRLVWSAVAGGVVVPGLVAGLFLVPADLVFPLLFMATLIGSTVAAGSWSRPADRALSHAVARGTPAQPGVSGS